MLLCGEPMCFREAIWWCGHTHAATAAYRAPLGRHRRGIGPGGRGRHDGACGAAVRVRQHLPGIGPPAMSGRRDRTGVSGNASARVV